MSQRHQKLQNPASVNFIVIEKENEKNPICSPVLFVSSSAQAAYEDHFPVYYEYCTGTEWKLQIGEVGGSPGNGFSYIHGLCKDYRSAYPQVLPCTEVSPELKKSPSRRSWNIA